MKTKRQLACALAGAAFAFGGAAAQAEPVTDWMAVSFKYFDEASRPGGPNTPPVRNPAVLSAPSRLAAAMFEAVNAVDRRYEPYFGIAPANGPASAEAALSAAAHAVLVASFPGKKAELDEALLFNLSEIPDGPAETEGVRVGQEAAKVALARVVFDPTGPFPPYVPPSPVGRYNSTTDPGSPPWMFGYKPWLLPTLKSAYPAPPPSPTSERYAKDYEETKRLGAKSSTARTPQQTAEAKFWWTAEGTSEVLPVIFSRPGRTLLDNARLNALVELSRMDTYVIVDTSKMELLAWRPYTAIRLGEDDGNPATVGDPNWEPLLRTPMSPEYPCGHCTSASQFAYMMEAELGPEAPDARLAASDMPGAAVYGIRWRDYARRAGESRIYAGAHFRYSMEEGDRLGREITRIARERFAKPLPLRNGKPRPTSRE